MEEEYSTGASTTESQITTENRLQSTTELINQTTNSSTPQAEIITTRKGTTATSTTTTVAMTPSPAVSTTTVAPLTVAGGTQNVAQADYTGQIRITNEAWNTALLDSSTDEYQNLESEILQLVSQISQCNLYDDTTHLRSNWTN